MRRLRRYQPFCRAFMILCYVWLKRSLEQKLLLRFAQRGVTAVWCVGNDVLPIIGVAVARGLGCPVHVSITDLPETYVLHRAERRYLQRQRVKWLGEVSSCDLASEGMRAHLLREHGCLPRNLVTWSSAGVVPRLPSRETAAQLRVIAYCGSMRFREELAALLRALECFADREGRRIVLRAYANRPIRSSWVEWGGYLHDERQLIAALRECDAGYSPMAFAASDRVLVSTSFPGKIATYLSARLPIIAHGPAYATNVLFIESAEVGLAIKTLDPEAVADALQSYERRTELREQHSANGAEVVQMYFKPCARARFFAEVLAPGRAS